MNNINHHNLVLLTVLFLAALFGSCTDIKVGYLDTKNAVFSPDSVVVYHLPDTTSLRYRNQAPYVSTLMQGVSGTAPINYELVGVSASEGGDSAVFVQLASEKRISMQGGTLWVWQDAAERLPLGKYVISVKVTNEDHEQTVSHCLTIIVKKEEPVSSDDWSDDGSYIGDNSDEDSGDYVDSTDNQSSEDTEGGLDQTNYTTEEGNSYE